MKLVAVGVALTAGVTVVLWRVWGSSAVLPGLVFGTLATGIQAVAVAAVKPVWDAPFDKFIGRWGLGIVLRLGGVVAFLLVVLVDNQLFPPLPTAFGYLGVVIPLLFLETRFVK
jgi:hypothetical protein